MSNLEFAGDDGSLSAIDTTQGEFREQIAVLTDLMKQVAGNAAVASGNNPSDPLSAPFTFFVNPYIGSDEFVGGSYNTYETGTGDDLVASELKRLEKQRLTCGYSPQRPFKTINRAVIEAAIVTSKNWYSTGHPGLREDSVSIVLSAGEHIVYNDPGNSSTDLTEWGAYKNPTSADLIEFNPATVGGLVLPRGVSLCGPDLRKTIIRPNSVPAVADEESDYSNRRAIFKITGTGYFFGFCVKDKEGSTTSHHLLDAFQFASQSELNAFYQKVDNSVGELATTNSNPALLETDELSARNTEYEIVAPVVRGNDPDETWDSTSSASPYIFNVSIRSDYGIGGAFMDGAKVSGLKSMVCANFTGTSLQKDMDCWQRYTNGTWTTIGDNANYGDYVAETPDDVRMNPARVSRHITAINDAFIQEVSVFAIGQGIHHFTDSGGEITVTNSNSSFGGCAAISKGYKTFAFPQDRNWVVYSIISAQNPFKDKLGNPRSKSVKRIYLGTVDSLTDTNSGGNLVLSESLNYVTTDDGGRNVDFLNAQGYSLRPGTRIWVENQTGDDWQAEIVSASPVPSNRINITNSGSSTDAHALEEGTTGNAVGTNPDDGSSLAIGKRVYIRRFVDTRTPSERRTALRLTNTASARKPERNFILQTDPQRTGGYISRTLDTTGDEVLLVTSTGAIKQIDNETLPTGTENCEITLRQGDVSRNYANNTYYRKGTTVKYANKHYKALYDFVTSDTSPNATVWGECFVHMEEAYNEETPQKNEAPILIFDADIDSSPTSADLGLTSLDFNYSDSTNYNYIQEQFRSGTDYLGAHAFLMALGYTSSNAHYNLRPSSFGSNRQRVPANFYSAPSGGAATQGGPWAVELRRPSVLRLYGHAWEWAGFLNYSKSIPAAQQTLGPQNKFTYYYTNISGGRVVPQGSNEDGFNITPRGLEDIESGATLSVEDIASADIDEFKNVTFENVQVTGELNASQLVVTNNIEFPPNATATTGTANEDLGIVRLADKASLEGKSILGGTTAQINSALEQNPAVVTIDGLNYWARAQNVLTKNPDITYIYVVPDNAVSGGTYSFQGVSHTLTEDPSRSGATLFSVTPESPTRAVKLSSAVAYGNALLSQLESATYFLADGPYWTSATFNHVATVWGNPSEFGDKTATIADYLTSSTVPNANVKNKLDNFSVPVFSIGINAQVKGEGDIDPGVTDRVNLRASPAFLQFNFGGRVEGVIWAGVEDTLANRITYDSNTGTWSGNGFPDSIYSPTSLSEYRNNNSTSLQNFVDNWIYNTYLQGESGEEWRLDKFYGLPTIYATESLNLQYVCFGGKAPGTGSIGYGNLGAHVYMFGDKCDLKYNGLYLLGNTKLLDLPNCRACIDGLSAGDARVYINENLYLGIRNAQHLFGARVAKQTAIKITIENPGIYKKNKSGEQWERNLEGNCLHVLDDNGNYALYANKDSQTGLRGATFDALIGDVASGSTVRFGSWAHTYGNFTVRGKYHGIAGVFGDIGAIANGGITFVANQSGPLGMSSYYLGNNRGMFEAYETSMWMVAAPPAATNTTVDNDPVTDSASFAVTVGTGEFQDCWLSADSPNLSDNASHNRLFSGSSPNTGTNIKVQYWKSGVDTVTGNVNVNSFYA